MPIPERIQAIRRQISRPDDAPRKIEDDQAFLAELAALSPPRLPEEVERAIKITGHQTVLFAKKDGIRGIAMYQQFKGTMSYVACDTDKTTPFALSRTLSGNYRVIHLPDDLVRISLPGEGEFRTLKATSAKHWIILEKSPPLFEHTSNYVLFYCWPRQ